MTTQMNPTDADIAGKLDGIKCGSFSIHLDNFISKLKIERTYLGEESVEMYFPPSDLLTFCRAVVEQIDGDKIAMYEKGLRRLHEMGPYLAVKGCEANGIVDDLLKGTYK